ncbi:MAG TPA: sensor domain-containing diguanylate cyclase [Candidatus Dormibacteraeota bacterium]|jgi:diguanylate cyclase (GGDEF)-like protein|nr:sensor domain-containing diguanylate cyclase [Candidatus Dormibacteraeota bacterium]
MAALRRGLTELRGWQDWRLSTKIMIFLLVVALGSIFFVNKQSETRSTQLLTGDQEKFQTSLADIVSIQVESQLLQYRAEVKEVATAPEVEDFMGATPDRQAQTGPALLARMKGILTADPDYRLLLLMDKDGNVVISDEPGLQGQSNAAKEFFTQGIAASADNPYTSDISLAEDRRTQIMYISQPVRDSRGVVLGVAAIRLSPDRVAAPLFSADLKRQGRRGFLINHDGVILANSASPSLDYRSLGALDPTQTARVKQQFVIDRVDSLNLDNLAASVAGTTQAGFAEAPLLSPQETDVIGYSPVPQQRWTVMVSEDSALFTKDIHDLSNSQFFSTVILALIIGGMVIFAGRMFESTERESLSDPLTGLANRRFFQEILLRELRRAQRANQPVALLIADIDHFKGVNDTYGHGVGDEVLEQVAGIMLSSVRATDFVIRYGGEEFIVLLPETRLADATAVAEKLRRTIGDTILESTSRPGITLKCTVSVGVAAYPSDGATGEQMILKADKALYFAKQNGRNRIATTADLESPPPDVKPISAARR